MRILPIISSILIASAIAGCGKSPAESSAQPATNPATSPSGDADAGRAQEAQALNRIGQALMQYSASHPQAATQPATRPAIPSAQPILQGRVIDQHGRPIADCRVTVGTNSLGESIWWATSVQLRTRTDQQGRFVVRLPYADVYYDVIAEADTRDSSWQGILAGADRDVVLRVEMPANESPSMERPPAEVEQPSSLPEFLEQAVVLAHIRGTVVDTGGRPIPGAMACMRVTKDDGEDNQYRYVTTDALGHFDLPTGHVGEPLSLDVADGRFGVSPPIEVAPVKDGSSTPELRVVLPGAIRITGVVRGTAGEPIPDVSCAPRWMNKSGVWTDARGRFDLGLLSIPPADQSSLSIEAPRPADGSDIVYSDDPRFVVPTEQVPHHRFYAPSDWPFAAKPGQTVDVPIQLRNDQLLNIRGQVVDQAGHPLAHASVYVFQGTPGSRWSHLVSPPMAVFHLYAVQLGECDADAKGRFSIFVLHRDGEPAAAGARYAIGITRDGKALKLVKDVIVAPQNHSLEMKISVDPKVESERGAG